MAWTGDVVQEVLGVRPRGVDHKLATLIFCCRHEQDIELSVVKALEIKYATCDQCSKPHRSKIATIRASIKFEGVLEKLKAFLRSK